MNNNPVIKYYKNLESIIGYRLMLKGVKHFGYYPNNENISIHEAQELMSDKLGKILNLQKESLVLDAGCGEGSVALYLANKYKLNIVGIDLLDFNIKRAKINSIKRGLSQKVTFIEGDYSNITKKDSSFDGVYTMETLVHSPDYKKTLKEFYRLLKPGGKLVMFEYSINKEISINKNASRAIKKMNTLSSMDSLNKFISGTWEEKLKPLGFIDINIINIQKNMLPMLYILYKRAYYPYIIIKLLHLESYFPNTMSAVEFYKWRKFWKYNIIEATKK